MIPQLVAGVTEAMLVDELFLTDASPSICCRESPTSIRCSAAVEVTFAEVAHTRFPAASKIGSSISSAGSKGDAVNSLHGPLMPKRPPPQVNYTDYGADGLPVEAIAALEHVSPSRIRNDHFPRHGEVAPGVRQARHQARGRARSSDGRMMDATSFAHLTGNNLVLAGLDEALERLDAGDLELARVLITECRLYLAEAVAADSTKH